jgi:hypothetical protein
MKTYEIYRADTMELFRTIECDYLTTFKYHVEIGGYEGLIAVFPIDKFVFIFIGGN